MTSIALSTLAYVAAQAMADGLNDVAKLVQEDARRRAPKDTHKLEASLKVKEATPRSLESRVYSSSRHAVPQHEQLEWRHDDGEAKYLENAALANRAEVERLVAAKLRQAFGA